jgi:type II secretory pathway pseudopilin PulG
LAALVVTTYNGIQQKARDTERKTDVNAIHGQVEAYQAQNGKYPTLANVNDATFRSANMKGLDPAALQDPKGNAQTLVASPSATAYAYAVSPANCDNGANGDCTSYTLTATLEAGGTYVKQSLN